jgi:hypothetical protein
MKYTVSVDGFTYRLAEFEAQDDEEAKKNVETRPVSIVALIPMSCASQAFVPGGVDPGVTLSLKEGDRLVQSYQIKLALVPRD